MLQVHSLAVPCVTLLACRAPGSWKRLGCAEGGGVSACTIPSVMLDFFLARCASLHSASRLQNVMGGRDSLAVLLLSVH